MSKLDEIKQALEAATPGPWEVDASCDYGTAVCENGNSFIAAWTRSMHRQNYPHRANAHLIANAPTWLAELVKVVGAARAYQHAMEGFAEAVRQDTNKPYPWEPGDIAGENLRKALEAFK